ncbi:MAG: DUF4279 domain-containing protein [Lentisphaeria bacterium]
MKKKVKTPTAFARVIINGDRLDPDYVSRVIGIQPSDARKKGDVRITCTNKRCVSKTGIWLFQPQSYSTPISEQINELLNALSGAPMQISKIDGVEVAFVDLFVPTDDGPKKTIWFDLTHQQIEQIYKLGLYVSFTVM